ncbi:MAG: RNA methyltransferase, partial [Holosporaceae bacterium]
PFERPQRKHFDEGSGPPSERSQRKRFDDTRQRFGGKPFRKDSDRNAHTSSVKRFDKAEARDKKGTFKSEPFADKDRARNTCLLWGFHTVIAALLNKRRPKKHLYITQRAHERLLRDDPGLFDKAATPMSIVHPDVLKHRFRGAVHQGMVLEAEPLRPDGFEVCLQRKGPLILVALDDVRDPQNVGTLFRTALAFNANGLLLPSEGLPPLDGALAKAAAGALDKIPFYRVPNLGAAIENAKKANVWCWGLSEDGNSFDAIPTVTRHMLVLGTEGKGLGPLLKKRLDGLFALPTNPRFPTLNVSVAGAVGLALLQKGKTTENPPPAQN